MVDLVSIDQLLWLFSATPIRMCCVAQFEATTESVAGRIRHKRRIGCSAQKLTTNADKDEDDQDEEETKQQHLKAAISSSSMMSVSEPNLCVSTSVDGEMANSSQHHTGGVEEGSSLSSAEAPAEVDQRTQFSSSQFLTLHGDVLRREANQQQID